ncbi:MAG TPA: multidrug transporter [Candidatus Omnitrophica bacterium]|nr:multidrug transporter [Candidatus Omnitrophota bacterium]
MNSEERIFSIIEEYSSPLNYSIPRISVILAAGHGKRIKSSTPKMLYEIWGVPSLIRVSRAAKKGLSSPNQVIVVGIKANEVIKTVGKNENTRFVYQEEQKGTGDAVRVALESIDKNFTGDIYIFPGDVGLITEAVIRDLKEEFENSSYQMMLLTGQFEGKVKDNYYGRVIKEKTSGEVSEIKEYKDILALKDVYKIVHEGNSLTFTKNELLNIREFNSGIYAFRGKLLRDHIPLLKCDNIQGEYYLTDMVRIFNENELKVGSRMVRDSTALLGFNDRVILKRMESLARRNVYSQLKEIVTFQDPEDFFIAEEVVEDILEMDRRKILVDLEIGKGAHISKGVKLSRGVRIGKNSYLKGTIILEEGVNIGDRVQISTYPAQMLRIGKNTEILSGDILKGNLQIGSDSRIESWVRITGSDEYPVRIGSNVLIKGTTYIFGCKIDDGIFIEHCVLKRKHVKKKITPNRKVQPLRYIFPEEEGIECLEDL